VKKIFALALCGVLIAPAVLFAAPPGGAHTATAEHGHPTEEAEESHELGPINWLDFSNKKQPPLGAYVLNFAVLVAVYVYFGKDRVKKGLVDRRASIKREIDEAKSLLTEAEKRAKKYQKKLGSLEADGDAAKKALAEAGFAERERIVRDAREKAARMERDAEFLLEQDLKQTKNDLVRFALDRAVASAEELLKKEIGPADHERLAEEYLAQLDKMSAAEFSQRRGVA